MAKEERDAYAMILASLLIASLFWWRMTTAQAAGWFDGPDGLMQWARALLWLMPVGMGVGIVSVILFNIGHGIVTRDSDRSDLVDERDRQIRFRGMQANFIVTSVGFVALIITLALGYPTITALNRMLAFCVLSELVGNLTRAWLYRRER